MTPTGARLGMIIGGDAAFARVVAPAAARGDWRMVCAQDGEHALAILGTRDGMMLDMVFTGADIGVAAVAEIHARRPALPIIARVDGLNEALAILQAGAQDYLLPPLVSDTVLSAFNRAISNTAEIQELRLLSEKLPAKLAFADIVGSDTRFRAALAVAAKTARARIPILIEGEAGVGIDMVAAAIHAASPRDKRPFIVFDCGRFTPNLLDSELFGHEKNAFPGAFARQLGKVSAAESGTLFVDNVGLLPSDVQAKLLRLIKQGETQRIGARGMDTADVRVIAASNTNLRDQMADGQFREDLFYALSTVSITLPPLRQRRGDIAALARQLLTRIADLPNMRGVGITDAALDLLSAYPWPGNVRQLQSTLLRAALACEGNALAVIDFPAVAAQIRQPSAGGQSSIAAGGVTLFSADGHLRTLDDIEADVIRLAIGHYRGRMSEVARRLGIGRSTLYRKLVELGITEAA